MTLIFPLIAGFLLGTIFFAGLWWTVHNHLASHLAGLWFSASLLIRTAIAITGIYFVAHDHWRKLLACLIGFTLARIAVTCATRQPESTS